MAVPAGISSAIASMQADAVVVALAFAVAALSVVAIKFLRRASGGSSGSFGAQDFVSGVNYRGGASTLGGYKPAFLNYTESGNSLWR